METPISPTRHRIPLFPLHTVLFPHTLTVLKIFEPRYLDLIRETLPGNGEIGVVRIRSGAEVGTPAEPFETGTTARILSVDRDQGLMQVVLTGEERFHIQQLIRQGDRLWAEVDRLDEAEHEGDEKLVDEVLDEIGFIRSIAGKHGLPMEEEPPTERDPVTLSYMVSDALPVDLATKQELLEMPDATQRLERLLGLMRRSRLNILKNTFEGGSLH